ncbi:MAG: hypothetical protein BWY78_01355 [Alphaproteobacteria bacterium ADurb.Bin438]|nr:MAG: hypothetical protein BWY78_01355 [Alphaproteobacteria bacterium ADurb.Bin438]
MMKENKEKTRENLRLEKQAAKLRENLKKRKIWQENHDKLQNELDEERGKNGSENKG